MNKINNKTVLVSTSSELKDALENDNGLFEYNLPLAISDNPKV